MLWFLICVAVAFVYYILSKKVVLDQGDFFSGDTWQCLESLPHIVPIVSSEAEKR